MHGLDWYDYGARNYEPVLSRFTTIDPLAEKYYSISPYAYCAGNPVMFVDPDGRYLESVWDIASLITGVVSFKSNIQQGNIGDAVVDGLGIVADGIALALPGIPGGVSAGIKGARVADKAVDAAGKLNSMQKLRKTAETGQEAHRQIQRDIKLADPRAEIEKTIELSTGKTVRKDAVKSDGTVVIIKPDTKSGRTSGNRREKLMNENGYKTEKIHYDPTLPDYQPTSPTYIGPKSKRINF